MTLRAIAKRLHRQPLWQQALMGGLAITGIEYGIGRIWNRRYRIWDYRRMPLNVQGQICLPFSLLWIPVSLGAMGLHTVLKRRLFLEPPAE